MSFVENNIQLQNSSIFEIKFWGVKDKIATPGQNTINYGGNTSCVEIKTHHKRLIFDAGTGLRELGNKMLSEMPIKAHLFFSHCDWDRIQGFPFFVPAFIPNNKFYIYGPVTNKGLSFEEHLTQHMSAPNFPVPIYVMGATLKFIEIIPDYNYRSKNVIIKAKVLNPDYNSLGYRVTYQGKSLVYATPREYDHGQYSNILISLAQNADLLIIPLVEKNWSDILEIAKLASVKKIVFTAHHPDYEDPILDKIQSELQSLDSDVIIAQEGMTLFI